MNNNLITEISRIKSLILEQNIEQRIDSDTVDPSEDKANWKMIATKDKDNYPGYTVKKSEINGYYYKSVKKTNSAGTPTNNSGDFLPCAKKKGEVKKTPNGVEVIKYKTTVWDKPDIQLYAKDNRFMVIGGKYKNKKGNYKCSKSGGILLELDKTNTPTPTTGTTTPTTGTTTPTTGTTVQTDFPLDPKAFTTSGDPYQYIVVDGEWSTKSWKNRGPGRIIKDWKSLKNNLKATKILDSRHPNARPKNNTVIDNKPSDTSKVNVVNPKITPEVPKDEFTTQVDADSVDDILNN
jgi:hypothetical protein